MLQRYNYSSNYQITYLLHQLKFIQKKCPCHLNKCYLCSRSNSSAMNDDRNKVTTAAFASFLKSKGMRDTYERRAILDTILELSRSFDFPTLAEALKTRGEQICRATIFNTLSLLIKADLLRRQRFADGAYLYETTAVLPAGNQLHLVCTSCGKISDLRNGVAIKEIERLKFGSFLPSYLSLVVYGLCSRCQRKAKKNGTLRESLQLKLFK